jgi:fibrillarin-like pre-rRNA processing protein
MANIRIREDAGVDNLYWVNLDGRNLPATRNLTPGISYYQERLLHKGKIEVRLWDPYRSKLAAVLMKGYRELPIMSGSKVLYLGASTGTTVSHVSDLVDKTGLVFAVEVAPRVARELVMNLVAKRKNIVPIIADARYPHLYGAVFKPIDIVYADIAQADQTEIALINSDMFLDKGGYLFLVIKARSIHPLKPISTIIEEEVIKVRNRGFDIIHVFDMMPFDRDHGFIIARKIR